jgi:hypothetical protein
MGCTLKELLRHFGPYIPYLAGLICIVDRQLAQLIWNVNQFEPGLDIFKKPRVSVPGNALAITAQGSTEFSTFFLQSPPVKDPKEPCRQKINYPAASRSVICVICVICGLK